MCNTLRRLACAAWIAVAACSDGSDLSLVANPNAAQEPPAPGATLPGVSPGGESSGVTPSAGSAGGTPPENAGPSAEPGGPLQPPAADEAPAAASGEEPQPSATETNFFAAGCRKDADCGEARRCELPLDAGAPPEADAGSDAAPPEALVPIGHCVAL